MDWRRFLRRLFRIKRKVRDVIPPADALDYYSAEPKSSFSEAEALKYVPTLAKIHALVVNASNRFRFYAKALGEEVDVLSYKFDYYASPALADWFSVGYCVFDEKLNYIPVATLPDREPDLESLMIIRNISSPFQAAQPVLAAAYEFYRIVNQALRNAGAHTFASFDAGVTLTTKEAEEIRKIFEAKRRKAGAGGVEFVSAPIRFQAISSDLASLKLTEIATLLNREICDLYSIDSSLLNDPENKTYANKDLALRALYTNTLIPAADRFCEAVSNAFYQRGLALDFGFDISAVENLLEDRMMLWSMLKDAYALNIVSEETLRRFLAKTAGKDLMT